MGNLLDVPKPSKVKGKDEGERALGWQGETLGKMYY